jgi:hypothetical protein
MAVSISFVDALHVDARSFALVLTRDHEQASLLAQGAVSDALEKAELYSKTDSFYWLKCCAYQSILQNAPRR